MNTSRKLMATGVLGALALAGGARAAGISTPSSNAGQGVAVVDGYAVTNVRYSSTLTDPATLNQTVDQVTFSIARNGTNTNLAAFDDTTTNVYVQLRATSGAPTQTMWYSCLLSSGGATATATCDTSASAMTLASVEALSVIAYDTTV